MHSHVLVLGDKRASRLQRLAASVGVYQQIGLSIEDTLATLIAWSIWARDSSVRLADIAYHTVLRADANGTDYDGEKLEEVRKRLSLRGKKAYVDGRRYLRALVSGVPPRELPALFGVPWKNRPSVHLVPKHEMATWNVLPKAIVEHVQLVTATGSELVTAYSNKLKHGPQMVVARPKTEARHIGYADSEIEGLPDAELVRVLLDGSHTALTAEEAASGKRVAPFLVDDAGNALRLLRRSVLDNANFMYALGVYLYRDRFRGATVPHPSADHALNALVISHFDTL